LQFHSIIFTAIATALSPLVPSYVDEYREMSGQDVMDRLVVLVPAWNSQYFPAPNSLLNLLTMNPLNSQFHSVIFTAIATALSPPVPSYVDEYREMLGRM